MADEKTNAGAGRQYRPGEVASEIGVAASTLRTWAQRFADHFDGGVCNRPLTQSGRPSMRLYTEQDMETLRRIKAMLASGLTFDQVGERLGIMDLPTVQEPGPSTGLAVVERLAEALTVIADQRRRLDDLEARLESLEKRARRRWAFWRRWLV